MNHQLMMQKLCKISKIITVPWSSRYGIAIDSVWGRYTVCSANWKFLTQSKEKTCLHHILQTDHCQLCKET